MSREHKFKNNFRSFESDFSEDTGLNAKKDVDLYIQYVNARMSDRSYQMTVHILNEIMQLPEKIAFHSQNPG